MKGWAVFSMGLIVAAIMFSCEVQEEITVTGPITGGVGFPFGAAVIDLDKRGYVEEEFFFESSATSYHVKGRMTSDGQWDVKEGKKEQYKTRLLVRRPADPNTFTGTVVVEWFNVSAGAEGAPGWMFNQPMIIREGWIWVGVGAQKIGIDGFFPRTGGLDNVDPERYSTLYHPGDAYSYDIFSDAGRIIRGEGTMDVLGGLTPERLLAYGESQSAFTLVTYANGVQKMVNIYDGIFIHSRSGIAIPLEGQQSDGPTAKCCKIRTDLDIPIFQFLTETDVMGFFLARQPDTDLIRTWEVPGTSHADAYLARYVGNAEVEEHIPEGADAFACDTGNEGPQYIVVRAALKSLDNWVKDGVLPPQADPIAWKLIQPEKDEHGNALGGIRTPHVDVPIATLEITGDPASGVCAMFGGTDWFLPEKLLELYPTHEDYVAKFTRSAQATFEAGFMLKPEMDEIIAQAQDASIPN